MPPQSHKNRQHLFLVYNADSGLIQALMHAVHKQIRPSTYPCSLCALTYGAVSMRGDWKRFLGALDFDVVFHHRDDFTAAFPKLGTGGVRQVKLPAILIGSGCNEPRILIPADELDALKDADELMAALGAKLALRAAHSRAAPSAA